MSFDTTAAEEDERARVVAWLRRESDMVFVRQSGPIDGGEQSQESAAKRRALTWAADAIERGEHLSPRRQEKE
jgi:hypothetical protein